VPSKSTGNTHEPGARIRSVLIVAERINASRKVIRAAIETMDSAAIQKEARAQDAAGGHYIDG